MGKKTTKRKKKIAKLKQLKYQHLLRIANERSRWNVIFDPRDASPSSSSTSTSSSSSSSSSSSLFPPRFHPKRVKMNGSGVISTCRLLSLTIDDYEGKALEILEDALQTSPST